MARYGPRIDQAKHPQEDQIQQWQRHSGDHARPPEIANHRWSAACAQFWNPTGVPANREVAHRQRSPDQHPQQYCWGRTRLDGLHGARIWTGHGVLGHNLVKIAALQHDHRSNDDQHSRWRSRHPSERLVTVRLG
jgi:hypothetical protein